MFSSTCGYRRITFANSPTETPALAAREKNFTAVRIPSPVVACSRKIR
jgi:hypothetical protein